MSVIMLMVINKGRRWRNEMHSTFDAHDAGQEDQCQC